MSAQPAEAPAERRHPRRPARLPAPRPAEPQAVRHAFGPRGTELAVLLLEDSVPDAELLLDLLAAELPEATSRAVPTLALALHALADGTPFDVAVTDLSLPDADGLEALHALLQARPDLAVVVLTGRHDSPLGLRALAAGAEDYLVKGAHDARAVARAVQFAAQRRRADQGARHYERLSASLLDAMESPTCAVDDRGTVIAVNSAWRAFARDNGGADDFLGADYFAVCLRACEQDDGGPDEDADCVVARQVAAGLQDVLTGRASRFERAYPCPAPDGERWFSVRISPLPDVGAVLSHVDVTAAKRAEQRLRHLALHDPLTGLPNRTLLGERLQQALQAESAAAGLTGVAFIDLDQFKRVNDSMGHPAGDELLRQVARRLEPVLRRGDTLARFAGDEFVVLWPGLQDEAELEVLAGRLEQSLRVPFVLPTATLTVTASVGLGVGRPGQSPDEVLLDADAAMYEAKRRGRGQVRWFTDELRAGALARLRLEQDLRVALEADELVVHYQPVVDLRQREVCGVEALVRWQHPSGLRTPDAFIDAAEDSGLVVPLGRQVLERACRQASIWAAQGLVLEVAVNFSARQISDPSVLQVVDEALRDAGLPPHKLLVEVTEPTLLEDAEEARGVFERLKQRGVQVAIDDFGTGYSSLLYLRRYPVSVLKVDRQFVAGLGSRRDDAIVSSVIALSQAVQAECIGEGVETVDQLQALARLGCVRAQGYLLSPPVPAEQVPDAVERARRVLADLPDLRPRA